MVSGGRVGRNPVAGSSSPRLSLIAKPGERNATPLMPVWRLWVEVSVGQPVEQGVDRHRRLHPGQRHSEAHMRAGAGVRCAMFVRVGSNGPLLVFAPDPGSPPPH